MSKKSLIAAIVALGIVILLTEHSDAQKEAARSAAPYSTSAKG